MNEQTAERTDAAGNRIWVIPEQNVDGLKAKVDKLNRRAPRLGVEPLVLTEVSEEFEEKTTRDPITGEKSTYKLRYVLVTLTGRVPVVDGWSFIATIQHDAEIGNTLRHVPGNEADLPAKYRTATTYCEHCNTDRQRNDTYILLSDAGEFKQVGRNCLADYIRSSNPEGLALWAQIIADLDTFAGEFEEEGFGGGHGEIYDALDTFLAWTSAVIRLDGWVSATEARNSFDGKQSTASLVNWFMHPPQREYLSGDALKAIEAHRPTESDKQRAAAAIQWASELSPDTESDYLHNLRVEALRGAVGRRNRGIAASMISAHLRAQAQEIERAQQAEKTDEYFGTLGERGVFTLTVTKLQPIESDYGSSTLVIFEDSERRTAKWFASGEPEWLRIGQQYTVDATVKAHSEYRGYKQTQLLRVAPHVEKAPKAKRGKGASAPAPGAPVAA